jgi:hypothetical protein
MKRTLLMAGLAIAASLVLSAPVTYADSITFTANLISSLEVPPHRFVGDRLRNGYDRYSAQHNAS